jgi:hypothetical protein
MHEAVTPYDQEPMIEPSSACHKISTVMREGHEDQ